ncbi:MAG: glycosyltransferase family 2 protein [Bacteroidales bacterium]
MKLISFLITYYNLEEWMLRRCIDSLLAQGISRSDFEIIVVDDGSRQSPENIIKSYQNSDIKFHRQSNGGPGAARNTAIKLAAGEYLLFVDGDDYLFEGAFNLLLPPLRKEYPDILTFSFQYCSKQEPVKLLLNKPVFKTYNTGANYILLQNLTGCNCLYLFRRQVVFQHNLCYTEGILHEDEEFITELFLCSEKILATDLPVYAYYKRSNSIVHHPSLKQTERRLCDFLFVINRLQQFQKKRLLEATVEQQSAIQKKIDFLALDFLLKIVRTRTPELYFQKYSSRLKEMGLFPLPDRKYSLKYSIFRQLSDSRSGRKILRLLDKWRSKKF